MKKRIILLALALALVASIIPAVIVSADGEATKPEIISNNIEYGERFSIMYAVDAATVEEGPVTLSVYADPELTKLAGIYTVSEPQTEKIGGADKSVYVFITGGVAPKNIADFYYAQATDGQGNKSEVVTYSVVQYMLERLYGGYEISEAQENMYRESLEFGEAAQALLSPDDEIKVSDYKYVRVEGGTVNGVAEGMFLKGEALALALNNAHPQGGVFFGWNNVNGDTDAYTDNEFVLSESAVIFADFAVGTLGYFEKFGGYDVEDAVSHWNWSVKNTAKIIRDGYTNGDSTDENVNRFNVNTVDGNKVWELIKGTGNGNLSKVYLENMGTGDYVIAEANVYFSDCTTVANDKEYARLGVTTDDHTTNGGQLSLRAFTDDDGVAYFSYFDVQLVPGNWYNLGWIYSKTLGAVTYYLNGREVGSVAVENNDLEYSDSYIALTGEAKGGSVMIDNIYTGLDDEHLADSDEYATFNDNDTSIVGSFENKSGSSSVGVAEFDGEKVFMLDKAAGGEDRVWFNSTKAQDATRFVFETKLFVDAEENGNMYFDFMNGSGVTGVYGIMIKNNGTLLLSDYYKHNGTPANSFSDTTYYIGGSQWIDVKLVGYKNDSDIWNVEIWINGTLMYTSTCSHWTGTVATDITAVRFRTFSSLDGNVYFDDVRAEQIAE